MAHSTVTESPAPSITRTSKPSMSNTQVAASEALAALLARRRGLKLKTGRTKKSKRVREVDAAKDTEREKEKERAVERNVRVLKRSGKVGEEEREVRRRILRMREKAHGKAAGKGKGKGKVVEEDDYESDD